MAMCIFDFEDGTKGTDEKS